MQTLNSVRKKEQGSYQQLVIARPFTHTLSEVSILDGQPLRAGNEARQNRIFRQSSKTTNVPHDEQRQNYREKALDRVNYPTFMP